MTAVSYVNTTKERGKTYKVHVLNMEHISADELERKLKEREIELIRLQDEEGHLRSEHR